MKKLPGKQKGASAIVTIIIIAVLAYAAYIGIQYVPQLVESKAIDSILDGIESTQTTNPVTSVQAANDKVTRMLQLNEMGDMAGSYTVERVAGNIVITFSYDRELNLVYKVLPMHYESSLRLN